MVLRLFGEVKAIFFKYYKKTVRRFHSLLRITWSNILINMNDFESVTRESLAEVTHNCVHIFAISRSGN